MLRKFRRLAAPIICFALAMLLLFLPGYRLENVPPVLLFFGRLHPVVLHFPIVLIILLVLLELLGMLRLLSVSSGIIIVFLLAATASTIVSVLAGFLLFSSGEYGGELIEQHMWAGVLTGSFVLVTMGGFFLSRSYPVLRAGYWIMLIVTTAYVGYASHLGGSVTHGQHYLTEHLQLMLMNQAPELRPREAMLLYEDVIQTVMESKCISCHNTQRAKGGIRLTSYEHLLRSGDSGNPCVIPGDPTGSEMLNRVTLPAGHSDRMPPEGKSSLSDDEISIFKYWIRSGAEENVVV
jgi:uncharacterized membrane protein